MDDREPVRTPSKDRDPDTEAFVGVGRARLWTATSGSGTLPVVLCHGGLGLCDNLGPVAVMLEDVAIVHRYDQRGGGRSSLDPPFTVARFLEDLEMLRRNWGHETWVVGGHSWGGWLSLLYALQHPDRASAILVIDTPPPPNADWRFSYRAEQEARLDADERAFLADVARRREVGETVPPDDERRSVHLLWRTEFADPDAAPDFDREPLFRFPANPEVSRALAGDMDRLARERDLLSDLRSISVPALFLHGEADLRPPPRDVIEAIPDARLVTIHNAGHLPWLERHDEVRGTLRTFLLSVAGRSR